MSELFITTSFWHACALAYKDPEDLSKYGIVHGHWQDNVTPNQTSRRNRKGIPLVISGFA